MRLVLANGCFDLLHEGHKHLLKSASRYGRLIVAVNSDESVRKLKGFGRPIEPLDIRIRNLEELEYVDEVVPFDDLMDVIRKYQPDIIVKGTDYKDKTVIGSDRCAVVLVPLLEGYSTTSQIDVPA